MSRLDFSRPFSPDLPSIPRAFRHRKRALAARLSAALLLSCCALGARAARADEFSVVPAGDPIYRQLGALEISGAPVSKAASLTRYEAALQVARVITRVSNDSQAQLSRAGWRALRELSAALKSELVQLGVDVTAAQTLTDRNLKAPSVLGEKGTDPLADEAAPGLGLSSARPPLSLGARGAGQNFLDSPWGTSAGTSLAARSLQTNSLSTSIMPRLRVGAALLALQRAESDPFQNSGAGQALLTAGANSPHLLGSDAALDYDVNSWLSVRASTSRRVLAGNPDVSPFLSGGFFNGATEARGAGGGLDIDLGALNFSTKIESLLTDTGARGTRVGGGIGLSAWQNRLSLSAHLARLQPEDRAVLPSTQAELNIGLGVTRRLSLSLLYQGLFSQQDINNTSRVAGGLNLSF